MTVQYLWRYSESGTPHVLLRGRFQTVSICYFPPNSHHNRLGNFYRVFDNFARSARRSNRQNRFDYPTFEAAWAFARSLVSDAS